MCYCLCTDLCVNEVYDGCVIVCVQILYHYRVSSFILALMVGQLPNLRMFFLDIFGNSNIFLMFLSGSFPKYLVRCLLLKWLLYARIQRVDGRRYGRDGSLW